MLSSSPLIISLTLVALLGVTPARADSGIAWQDYVSQDADVPNADVAYPALDRQAAGPTRASPRQAKPIAEAGREN